MSFSVGLRSGILRRNGLKNWYGKGWLADMTVVTSRLDFEALMVLRMDEAKHLLALSDWDGAYYLAGYAVEFALKIRIRNRAGNNARIR